MDVDAALVELLRKVKVHELAVVVEMVGPLAARLQRELPKVLKVNRGALVHFGRHNDDACVVPLDVVEEEVREEERADVVRASVKLNAIGRRLLVLNGETGVVHDALELRHLLLDVLRELPYRLEAGEVQLHGNHLTGAALAFDLLDRRIGFGQVAAGENDDCASLDQAASDLIAESGVGSRDNENLSLEIVICVDPA
jgi:hypothetical protein